jgi:hypothetical protein
MRMIEVRHDPGWIPSSGEDAGAEFRLVVKNSGVFDE